MAAHAVPPEYKGRSQEYLELIVEEMLPRVKAENLAEFCDIFCKRRLLQLTSHATYFLKLRDGASSFRVHADEIESIGGIRCCQLR